MGVANQKQSTLCGSSLYASFRENNLVFRTDQLFSAIKWETGLKKPCGRVHRIMRFCLDQIRLTVLDHWLSAHSVLHLSCPFIIFLLFRRILRTYVYNEDPQTLFDLIKFKFCSHFEICLLCCSTDVMVLSDQRGIKSDFMLNYWSMLLYVWWKKRRSIFCQ